jgi:hypothetical protein
MLVSTEEMTMGDAELTGSSDMPRADGNGDGTRALRAVIQLTLRTDLRRVIAGCPIEQSGMRENLRAIGAHARRHQLRAEQLLVMIKDVCASLPEARELGRTPAGTAVLSQLVPIAVDEFYGASTRQD